MTAIAVTDAYGVVGSNPFVVAAPGVLANDRIASHDALTVSASAQPSHGSVTVNADGSFRYVPTSGYAGADGFSYTARDAQGGTSIGQVNLSVAASGPVEAVVEAGPRLASVNSSQGTLLNTLLGGALGGGALNLSADDYNALANGSINGGALLDSLQSELGLASPSQALNAQATVQQVYLAAAQAAQAGGNTAEANVLNALAPQVAGLTGTVSLADLLQLDLNSNSLAQANLNTLDLVTGTAQLFNSKNVLTTPTPITVSGASLGLGSLVNSVAISAQAVEPPVFVAGVAGTQFHTAAERLKLDVNLVNLTPDSTGLASALKSALAGSLGPLVNVQASVSLGHLEIYGEVASADGTIAMVDAAQDAVTIQATPGVVDLYLGDMADGVFFNRSHAINPATDLNFSSVGNLSLKVTTGLIPVTLANVTAGIGAKATAVGQAPFASTLNYTGPYAETQTASTSATFATNLINNLVGSLQLQVQGSLGATLDPLVNGTILPALKPIVSTAITPALSSVLANVADPALASLGVSVGQEDVTVEGLGAISPPIANQNFVETSENTPVGVAVLGDASSSAGDILSVRSVTQGASGSVTLGANNLVTYTPGANFSGTDAFSYTLADPLGNTSTSEVFVTVDPTILPAVAANDSYATQENHTLTVAAPGVLANDTDPNGRALTAAVVAGPSHGTLALNADGSFTYTPSAGYSGGDSFTYQDSDGLAASNTATVTLTVTPVIQAPVAANDAYSATQGTPLIVAAPGVLANDSDPNGRALTASLVASPSHGVVVLQPNGSFTYVPGVGFSGTDSFTYQDNDGLAASNVATVTLAVAAVHLPPVANNDLYAATEGTTLAVAAPGVLANDVDPQGQPLTAALVAGPSHGSVALQPNGSFTYTPAAGYFGADAFTYRDSDGIATGNTATVAIDVARVISPPTAAADSYSLSQGATLTVAAPGVLANDSDPNGLTLVPAVVSPPSHGVLVLAPDGSLSYTPAPGFSGSDSFTYQDGDGLAASNVATVTLAVAAVHLPPVANDDLYAGSPNTVLTVSASSGVLTNDVAPQGNPLTAALGTNPSHGSVVLNSDGSFTYTPVAGFQGADSFTYHDNDGTVDGNTATVTINVKPNISSPTAVGDSYSLNQGATLTVAAPGVLANDTDPNGRPLVPAVVSPPSHGVLVLSPDGSLSYTPAPGFSGTDSFTYQDNDGLAASNVATVTLAVAAVHLPPVANNDLYAATEGTTLAVAAPGVLANDVDPQGQTLTAALVAGPSHGSVALQPNGSFTYTPAAGYYGADAFTYRDSDGTATGNTATVAIDVARVISPPTAAADSYSLNQGATLTVAAPGVLANDTDPNGRPLVPAVVSPPSHGVLVLSPDGSLSYTPAPGFSGSDSFTYQDNDGLAASNVATVTLAVAAVHLPPVANDDLYAASEGTTLAVAAPGVLANDVDPQGQPLAAALVAGPSHGTLALSSNGSFTYTPAPGYYGADAFTYRDTDGTATGNTATVAIDVARVISPPTAAGDSYSLNQGTTLTVAAPGVLANDSDPNGLALTAVVVAQPSHGLLTLGSGGSVSYTPFAGFSGTDTFTYQDSDGVALSNPATVTLRVTPVNQAPVAEDDSYVTPQGGTLTIAAPGVLANDTDPSGLAISAVLASQPSHGTVRLGSDGSFVYTPSAGYAGSDSFTYRDTDGSMQGNLATVNVRVTPIAQPPVAGNDHFTVNSGTSLVVAAPGVLGNDTDPAGSSLRPILVAGPSHGTIQFNADGSFLYTPLAGFTGADSFTYEDDDGTLLSNVATVSLGVMPVFLAPTAANDPPASLGDAYVTPENTPLTIAGPGVLGNDVDPNGLPLHAVLASGPAHGTLVLNADGSFTYTPNASYSGPDSFTYQDGDGQVTGNAATVHIRVTPVVPPPVDLPSVAGDDKYAVISGKTLVVGASGVLGNDSDPQSYPIYSLIASPPQHGTVTLNTDGSFTYVPKAGFVGTDSFSYFDADGKVASNTATVTIAVESPPAPPTPPADLAPPTVIGPLSFRSVKRLGFHAQPTELILSFSEPLNAGRADNLANYSLHMVGKVQRSGSVKLGKAISIAGAEYDASARTVTLTFRKTLPYRSYYQLRVNGSTASGLSNTFGVLLDGGGTGKPGSDLVIEIGPAALAGRSVPAATVKVKSVATHPKLSPRAVDSVLAAGLPKASHRGAIHHR